MAVIVGGYRLSSGMNATSAAILSRVDDLPGGRTASQLAAAMPEIDSSEVHSDSEGSFQYPVDASDCDVRPVQTFVPRYTFSDDEGGEENERSSRDGQSLTDADEYLEQENSDEVGPLHARDGEVISPSSQDRSLSRVSEEDAEDMYYTPQPAALNFPIATLAGIDVTPMSVEDRLRMYEEEAIREARVGSSSSLTAMSSMAASPSVAPPLLSSPSLPSSFPARSHTQHSASLSMLPQTASALLAADRAAAGVESFGDAAASATPHSPHIRSASVPAASHALPNYSLTATPSGSATPNSNSLIGEHRRSASPRTRFYTSFPLIQFLQDSIGSIPFVQALKEETWKAQTQEEEVRHLRDLITHLTSMVDLRNRGEKIVIGSREGKDGGAGGKEVDILRMQNTELEEALQTTQLQLRQATEQLDSARMENLKGEERRVVLHDELRQAREQIDNNVATSLTSGSLQDASALQAQLAAAIAARHAAETDLAEACTMHALAQQQMMEVAAEKEEAEQKARLLVSEIQSCRTESAFHLDDAVSSVTAKLEQAETSLAEMQQHMEQMQQHHAIEVVSSEERMESALKFHKKEISLRDQQILLLKQENEHLLNEKVTLAADLAQVRRQSEETESAVLSQLRSQVASLQSDVSTSVVSADKLTLEVQQLHIQLEAAKRALSDEAAGRQTAVEELSLKSRKISDLEADAKQQKSLLQQLQTELAAARNKISALEVGLSAAQEACERSISGHASRVSELQGEIEKLGEEHEIQLASARSTSQQTDAERSSRIAQLEDQLRSLQKEYASQTASLRIAEQKLVEFSARVSQTDQELSSLRAEHAQLVRTSESSMHTSNSRINSLLTSLASAESESTSLSNQLSSKTVELDAIKTKLTQTRVALAERTAELEEALAGKSRADAQLNEKVQELDVGQIAIQQQSDQLLEKNIQLQGQCDTAIAQLESVRVQWSTTESALRDEIHIAQDAAVKLHAHVSALSAELAVSKEQCTRMQAECTQWKANCTRIEAECAQLQVFLDKATQKKLEVDQILERQRKDGSSTLETTQQQLVSAQERLCELESAAVIHQAEMDQLRGHSKAEKSAMADEYSSLKAQHHDATAKLHQADQQRLEQEKLVLSLQQKLQEATTSVEKMRAEYQAMKAQANDVAAQLKESQLAKQGVEKNLHQLELDMTQAGAELKIVATTRDRFQEQYQKLSEQHDRLSEQHAREIERRTQSQIELQQKLDVALSKHFSSSEQTSQQLLALTSQRDALTVQLNTQSAQFADERTTLQQKSAAAVWQFTEERAALQQKVSSLESDLAMLKRNYAEQLDVAVGELRTTRQAMEEAQTQLRVSKQQHEDTQTFLRTAKLANEDLQAQLRTTKMASEDLRVELSKTKRECGDMEERAERLERQLQQLPILESKLRETAASLHQREREFSVQESKLRETTSTLNQREAQWAELAEKHADAKSQLSKLAVVVQQTAQQVPSPEPSPETQTRIALLSAAVEHARMNTDASSARIALLSSECDQAKRIAEQAGKEKAVLEWRLSQAEAEIARLQLAEEAATPSVHFLGRSPSSAAPHTFHSTPASPSGNHLAVSAELASPSMRRKHEREGSSLEQSKREPRVDHATLGSPSSDAILPEEQSSGSNSAAQRNLIALMEAEATIRRLQDESEELKSAQKRRHLKVSSSSPESVTSEANTIALEQLRSSHAADAARWMKEKQTLIQRHEEELRELKDRPADSSQWLKEKQTLVKRHEQELHDLAEQVSEIKSERDRTAKQLATVKEQLQSERLEHVATQSSNEEVQRANKQVAGMRAQVAEMIDQLEAQQAASATEQARSHKQLQAVKMEVADLAAQLDSQTEKAAAELLKAHKQLQSAQAHIATAEAEQQAATEASAAEVLRLQKQLSSSRAIVEELQQQLQSKSLLATPMKGGELAKMGRALAESRADVEDLQSQLEKNNVTFAAKSAEISKLNRSLSEAKAEVAELTEKLDLVKNEATRSSKQLTHAKAQVEQLTRQIDEQSNAPSASDAAKAKQALLASNNRIEDLTTQLNDFQQAARADFVKLNKALQETKRERDELQVQLDDLTSELTRTRAQLQSVRSEKDTILAHIAERPVSNSEKLAPRVERSGLGSSFSLSTSSSTNPLDLLHLKDELTFAQQSVEDLKLHVQKSAAEVAEQKKARQSAEQQADDALERLAALREEQDLAQRKHNEKLEALKKQLKEDRTAAEEEQQKQSTLISALQSKLRAADTELHSMRDALADVQSNLAEVNKRLATSQGKLSAAVTERDTLKSELSEIQSQLQFISTQYRTADATAAKRTNELEGTTKNVTELQEELSRMRKRTVELEGSSKSASELQDDLASSHNTLSALQDELSKAREALSSAQVMQRAADASVQRLESDLAQAKASQQRSEALLHVQSKQLDEARALTLQLREAALLRVDKSLYDDALQALEKQGQTLQAMERAKRDSEALFTSAQSEKVALEQHMQSLKQALADAEHETASTVATVHGLQHQLTQANKVTSELDNELVKMRHLESDLRSARAETHRLLSMEVELSSTKQSYLRLKEDFAHAKKLWEAEAQKLGEQVQRDQEELRECVDTIQNQAHDLQVARLELVTAQAESTHAYRKIDSMKDEIETVQAVTAALDHSRRVIAALEADKAGMELETTERDKLAATLSTLQTDHLRHKRESEKVLLLLKQREEQIIVLAEQKAELESRIKSSGEALNAAEEKRKYAEAQSHKDSAELASTLSQNHSLSSQHASLSIELERVRSVLKDQTAVVNEARSGMAVVQERAERVEKALEQERLSVKQLEQAAVRQEARLATALNASTSLSRSLQSTSTHTAELEARLHNQMNELTEYKAKLLACTQLLHEARSGVQQTQVGELSEYKSKLLASTQLLQEARAEVQLLANRAHAAESDREEVRRALESTLSESQRLVDREREDSRRKVDQMRRECENMQQQVEQAREEQHRTKKILWQSQERNGTAQNHTLQLNSSTFSFMDASSSRGLNFFSAQTPFPHETSFVHDSPTVAMALGKGRVVPIPPAHRPSGRLLAAVASTQHSLQMTKRSHAATRVSIGELMRDTFAQMHHDLAVGLTYVLRTKVIASTPSVRLTNV